MAVAGSVVHQQLIQAYQETQHELERARGHVAAAGAELGELSEGRGDALLRLAQHYLPELTEEAIRRTWTEVRQSIKEVLERKSRHSRRLLDQIETLNHERLDAEARLQSTSESLDQAMQAQGETAQRVSQELSDDPEFARLTDSAAQAESALQRAEANLAEIEQDAVRKLPAYENSALFKYLLDRQFGLPSYRSRGVTRRIDQWLGRYIDYREARKGYEFLLNTPKHMREVIASDRAALNTVMEELERRRDVVAQRLGLPAAIERTESLSQQRQTLLQALEQGETQSDALQHELTEIEDTRGPYYHEAIAKFRDRIAQTDSKLLAERARATTELEDDEIVAHLQGIQSSMEHVGSGVRERQQQILRLTDHLQSIGTLIGRFRSAGYDSSQSTFSGTGDMIQELRVALEGHDSCEAIWQRLRRSHRIGPSVIDQFTRVATHPMTQVLINAMAHAAAGALQARAREAGQRRSSSGPRWSGGGGFGGGGRSGGNRGGGSRGGGGFSNRGGF